MQNVRLSKAYSHKQPPSDYFKKVRKSEGPQKKGEKLYKINNYVSQDSSPYETNSVSSSAIMGNFGTASSEIENNKNFEVLLKQQKELLDLQSSVQKSLQMIQERLKEEKTTKVMKKKKDNLARISSASCYKKEAATPEKTYQGSSMLHRSQSGTGLSMGTSFKRRVKNNQSFVSHAKGYVDYSEVTNEGDSVIPKEMVSPCKKIVNKSICKNDGSARRTRAMRSHVASKEPTQRSCMLNTSINNASSIGKTFHRKKRDNKSFINFNPKTDIRANTPFLNRKTNKTPCKNNLSIIHKSQKDIEGREMSRNNPTKMLRLELLKAGRNVTMKHLNNLCTRATPEIKKAMQVFCMLLNVFKLEERRIKVTTYMNWGSLCKYICKHNTSITSEVISAANKIEKGAFNTDLMEKMIDEFQLIDLRGKVDSSLRVIYGYLKAAVEFYDLKQNPRQETDKKCYSSVIDSHLNQERSLAKPQITERLESKRKYSDLSCSKDGNNIMKKTYKINQNEDSFYSSKKSGNYQKHKNTAPQRVNESVKTILMKPVKTINESFEKRSTLTRSFSNFSRNPKNTFKLNRDAAQHNENESEPNDASNLPSPVKHNKPLMTRINPKLAQDCNISSSKESIRKVIIESPLKEMNKSISNNNLSLMQIDSVTKIITEESFEDRSSNFYETPKSIFNTFTNEQHPFDSYRRYASEHEQELKVKPEKFENIEFEESDSSYSELNIDLKQCDKASNDSSNMTPRLERQKDIQTPKKMNREITFTESMARPKLSPEHIAIVQKLTSNRKREIEEQENELSPTSVHNCQVPVFTLESTKSLEKENSDMFSSPESIREKRRLEIMERLDNLL
ncbi:unnamed protein product [Moneuplotes crassus]|uniref:Uncharacterized protein n=1 Tax=Euplotes crassus TaxID=5936 RepID=A0AAD1Y1N4_EUPCR|nr:unnamed protein product [Moneuplotes crassus]